MRCSIFFEARWSTWFLIIITFEFCRLWSSSVPKESADCIEETWKLSICRCFTCNLSFYMMLNDNNLAICMYQIKCGMTTTLLISQIGNYERDMIKLDSSKYALLMAWPGCNRRGWEYFPSQVLSQFSTVGMIKGSLKKISWRCVTFQSCFFEEHCEENNYDGCIEKDEYIIHS